MWVLESGLAFKSHIMASCDLRHLGIPGILCLGTGRHVMAICDFEVPKRHLALIWITHDDLTVPLFKLGTEVCLLLSSSINSLINNRGFFLHQTGVPQ